MTLEDININWASGLSTLPDDPSFLTMEMDMDWTGAEDVWPFVQDNDIAYGEDADTGNPVHDKQDYDVPRSLIDAGALQKATTAYENNNKESENHGDEGSPLYNPDYSETKYELRAVARDIKPGVSTWLDQDKTGDYDPEEEARRFKAQQRQQRIRSQRQRDRAREEPWSGAGSSNEEAGGEGDCAAGTIRLWATLKFETEVQKLAFAKIILCRPPGPDRQLCDSPQEYNLRDRTLRSTRRRQQHGERAVADDEQANTTGKPWARGCWECYKTHSRCPILDDETLWPCQNCIDEDVECQLVIPPIRKRVCESCKKKRRSCSYRHTEDSDDTCYECDNEGWCCVAGPAKDSVQVRIRYPADGTDAEQYFESLRKRTVLRCCKRCKEEGHGCSLIDDKSGKPCVACDMAGVSCTRDGAPQPQHHNRYPAHPPQKPRKQRSRKDLPNVKKDDTLVRSPSAHFPILAELPRSAGTRRTICTKFSHPMIFNHEDATTDASEPCHFCSQPSYAIIGLEQRRVDVIDSADGRGCTELGGGHQGEGVERTRVCLSCTCARMSLMMCEKHDMRPRRCVAGGGETSSTTGDFAAAFDRLADGVIGAADRWCAICPSLAIYECCSAQPCAGEQGCGMELCGHCCSVLAGQYDGDLQEMLRELEDEPTEERPLGLRADYDLLKQDGLLMRYVLYSSTQ